MTTFYPPYSFGGDALYIYRLAHALGEAGHHVDVIHDLDAYKLLHPADPELTFSDHPNVTVHALKSKAGPLSPLVTQQTGHPAFKSHAIREVLNSKPYDVIHFHNMSLLGLETLKLEPAAGQAVKLYTAHEHWLICPTHVLWKFNREACVTPNCLACTLHAKRPPQLWRNTGLIPDAARHVDAFLSPSRFTASMHQERGFPEPVRHLPYFIDSVDSDWQTPAPRPQEAPYFLFVGRLEVIKGVQTLIDLWDRVPGYDLLIAGSGTHASKLRAKAAGNPRIKFLGPQSQRDPGALYHHAVASLVSSITYETFGMILIESFARKTPVVVRDLGALPEVVTDSGGGIIYRTDDELLAALHALGGQPQLRNQLGEKGYCAFSRYWSRDAHLSLYFDLLGEIATHKFGQVPWARSSCDVPHPEGGISLDRI